MRLSISLGLATCLLASLGAQSGLAQGSAPAPFVVHPLAQDVYWVEGGGGNSGIIVGKKGVVVIDAKTTAAGGKELLDQIAKITSKPVTTVVLTHSDGDHVNGLAAFPAGVKVVAQQNNLKEQQAALAAGGRGAPPADHLPNQIVSTSPETLSADGVTLELLHWGPAHTSGDLVVYLPAQQIVFTGDIIATNRPDPLIHREKNGSSEGWIETTKGILALNANIFVPGHGNVQTKAEIQKRLSDVEAKRAKIKELVAQGKTLDEIKAAVGDAPASANRGGPNFASFTDVVYQELTGK